MRDRQNDAVTRTAWFHCFAGTAGDMTMAALGRCRRRSPDDRRHRRSPRPRWVRLDIRGRDALRRGRHPGTRRRARRRSRPRPRSRSRASGIFTAAIAQFVNLIDAADLPERVRDRAQRTFAMLADVEGKMHRMPADDVEFHEVGSVDAIVDIVGTCAALESLDVERIVCSSITVGEGTVLAAHGQLPNPAPAVTELLARRNAPSRGIDDRKELATPTGVALMCALADEFGPMPAFNVSSVGYGAGSADIPGRPNVVQVVIGEAACDEPGTGAWPVRPAVGDQRRRRHRRGDRPHHRCADRCRRTRRVGHTDRDEEGTARTHRARAVRPVCGGADRGAVAPRDRLARSAQGWNFAAGRNSAAIAR